jgi:membrane dipeptidase
MAAMTWFDAHLDLAYLAVRGRDMLAALDPGAGPHPPAALTLPVLREGGVRFALATIFTEPLMADDEQSSGVAPRPEPQSYPPGDVERAFAAGRAQLEVYLTWRDRGEVALDLPRLFRDEPGVGAVRGGMGVAEPVPFSMDQRLARVPARPRLRLGLLMENADPIRAPEDLAWWVERGVCAVGLAWARPSRYAGGNLTTLGLTDLGRALVGEMDRLGVVHDASHLSDRALADLFERTDRPVMASHSNCRAQADGVSQRHLADAAIRELARRGGVIGLNLFSAFLRRSEAPRPASPAAAPAPAGAEARATLDDCIRHLEHIRDLVGHSRCIGLGSDMDGGFGADRLPRGIDSPRDLDRLVDAFSARGWSDDDILGFAWKNWARFWSTAGAGGRTSASPASARA